MTSARSDCMKALAAADPALDLRPDDATRAEVWDVVAAAVRSTPVDPRRARRFGFRSASLLAPAVLLLMVAAAFGSGLIPLGSPAKTVEGFEIPSSGFGAVVPGSAKVLPLSTPDPSGGPPWGLRAFTTTRGAGCIQVGRLVDGQIGVLGANGAFGNDGRLHPLPVASTSDMTCSALDGNGHIFDNVSKSDQLANALDGPEHAPTREEPEMHDVCAPALATPAEKSEALGRICPQSAERDLVYGLLGPSAESVTYLDEGKPVTLPTAGPEGAYLIVMNSAPGWRSNAFGPGETGNPPLDSPIVEIHYTNGAVCHVTASGGDAACLPNGLPIGYVPAAPTPTPSQTAAPVTSQVIKTADGHYEALVSFNAPLAVNSVRDVYKIRWKHAGATPSEESVNATQADVSQGQPLTARTGPLPAGETEVQAVLQHATGPALLEGPGTVYVPVGHVTVTVP